MRKAAANPILEAAYQKDKSPSDSIIEVSGVGFDTHK